MSTAEYKKTVYDRIGLVVRKGKREEYQQVAKEFGLTLSELFKNAVDVFIAEKGFQDLPVQNFKPAPMNDTQPKLSQAEQKLISDFNRLPADAQKAITKLIQTINNQNTQNQPE